MKINLAINPENPIGGAIPTSPGESPEGKKPMYPEFTSQSEQLANNLTVGQEITATVRMKVTELRQTKGSSKDYMKDGASVTLEVIDMDVEGLEESAPEEGSGEAEMDEFFRGKPGFDGAPMEGEEEE